MALKSADDKRTIKPENLFEDRARTNILKKGEQRLIRYLLEKVPPFITQIGRAHV